MKKKNGVGRELIKAHKTREENGAIATTSQKAKVTEGHYDNKFNGL